MLRSGHYSIPMQTTSYMLRRDWSHHSDLHTTLSLHHVPHFFSSRIKIPPPIRPGYDPVHLPLYTQSVTVYARITRKCNFRKQVASKHDLWRPIWWIFLKKSSLKVEKSTVRNRPPPLKQLNLIPHKLFLCHNLLNKITKIVSRKFLWVHIFKIFQLEHFLNLFLHFFVMILFIIK